MRGRVSEVIFQCELDDAIRLGAARSSYFPEGTGANRRAGPAKLWSIEGVEEFRPEHDRVFVEWQFEAAGKGKVERLRAWSVEAAGIAWHVAVRSRRIRCVVLARNECSRVEPLRRTRVRHEHRLALHEIRTFRTGVVHVQRIAIIDNQQRSSARKCN